MRERRPPRFRWWYGGKHGRERNGPRRPYNQSNLAPLFRPYGLRPYLAESLLVLAVLPLTISRYVQT